MGLLILIYLQGFILFFFLGMAYHEEPLSAKELLLFGLKWPQTVLLFIYNGLKKWFS